MMRRLATLEPDTAVRRLVLFETDAGVYLFGRESQDDGPADWDHCFSDVRAAESYCAQEYGIGPEDWQLISDPLPGCQDDWVAPVRVKGRVDGKPEWGAFEQLQADGIWREVRTVERGAG